MTALALCMQRYHPYASPAGGAASSAQYAAAYAASVAASPATSMVMPQYPPQAQPPQQVWWAEPCARSRTHAACTARRAPNHGACGQAADGLPAGWTQHTDPATSKLYYHNESTGETTWDRHGQCISQTRHAQKHARNPPTALPFLHTPNHLTRHNTARATANEPHRTAP